MMFYKGKSVFHIIDRCIRFAAGQEMPDKTMTSLMEAYHQVWMQHGPANILYSDGEGAFSNPTAKEILKFKGTELRMRARGQHATSIASINGILRHTMHVMEE